ncbi:acyl-ACP thioesterase domain-containing protein [Patulibacter defluvii]|uniref:acyl-ACP thioesterase domain-containing protein n=1 Tax=Patulibacter defluvii TaxID=3095358 RepID=UPI002A750220|nr:acyl-ACP thioesterase domain-containing protein [Patulibacter sp. DM4]
MSDALPPLPTTGRVYRATRRVGPGEVSPVRRARLDALADWLQQVAYEDVVQAGLEHDSLWLVRRTTIVVRRFPVFGERVELRTACSAIGTLVAERRTSIVGEQGAAVEASALWVPLDPATLRPRRTEAFTAVYGPSAAGRRAKARLRHPAEPTAAATAGPSRPWRFAVADLDLADHVNNAAYWRILEQELREHDAAAPLRAEVEHHAEAGAGDFAIVADGPQRWLVDGDGAVRATARIEPGA